MDDSFVLLNVEWPTGAAVDVTYNPTFEPGSVAGQSFAAVDRSFATWDVEVGSDIVSPIVCHIGLIVGLL